MTAAVPFLDMAAQHLELAANLELALRRVIHNSSFILGSEGLAFESEWAVASGAKHCAGVGNGLDALHLGLRAVGAGPGDEVIVPANTYIASWLAISHTGAIPVPVEPDERTYNLNPTLIEQAITPKTRAILVVHLYGQPADMEKIVAIARKHHLAVVSDAAQAHGARYCGQPVGGLGDIVGWSFYPSKNLGALGDGGAVTSNSHALVDHVRRLRNYGSNSKNVHEERGFNSRLDELQAAFLTAKLAALEQWNARRREIAVQYLTGLRENAVILPFVPDFTEPSWHLFVIRTNRRADLQKHLADRGIETMIHYPYPPHLQAAYSDLAIPPGTLPIAEMLSQEILSLPMGPHLTDNQVAQVIDSIRSFPA